MYRDRIAVVDSGVGGLDILKSLIKSFPNESFIFIGDNKNVPYGKKSKAEIESYGIAIAKYLEKQEVKLIIIACNTLSLNAIDKMRMSVSTPIYGIARPTVKRLLNHDKKSVLVLATLATVKTNRYKSFLNELDPSVQVYQEAAISLVDKIEANQLDDIDEDIKGYIDPYFNKIDSIILGCTHYPIIKDRFERLYPDLLFVDSRNLMVQLTKEKLEQHNIKASKNNEQKICIQATGSIEKLKQASAHFFDYEGVELIERSV